MQRKNLLFVIIAFVFTLSAFGQFRVVIDAGHGGKDPGAIGKKLREKDINLKLALRLGELIKSNHSDVKVLYTRSTDVFIPLIDRADFANRNKANLFISIHTNAAKSHAAYGTETFVLGLRRSNDNFEVAKRENAVILLEDNYQSKYEGFDPNSPESYIMFELMHNSYMGQSIKLASMIQDQYKSRTSRASRGVSQDIFLVLKNAGMPAVLTEVGFISNAQDENFLASSEGIESIAQSIYRGFAEYKQEHNRKSSGVSEDRVVSNETIKHDSSHAQIAPSEKEKEKEKVSEKTKEETNNQVSNKLSYRIQFLSYTKKLSANSKLFKGIKNVDSYYYKGMYRYVVGEYPSQQAASKELRRIAKTFPEAFIIKMRNGQREL